MIRVPAGTKHDALFHELPGSLRFQHKEPRTGVKRGIAREIGARALAVGGVADHVHVLRSLPATLSIAKAVQLLKGNSSKWLHQTFPQVRNSGWQEGYGL